MFNKLKSLFSPEQKSLPNLPLVSLYNVGQPYWAPRNYGHFARAGFSGNAVAYRCVRMIAEAAASVPLLLYKGDAELAAHPFLDLMRRPNPAQAQRDGRVDRLVIAQLKVQEGPVRQRAPIAAI